jgi:PAS domain S-box-containing protein
MQIFKSLMIKFWMPYKLFIERLILGKGSDNSEKHSNLRDKLFVMTIAFALPMSILCLIPSVLLEFSENRTFIAAIDIISLLSVVIIALNSRISLQLRKVLTAVVIILFSIILMAFMGSFTMGCLYLFSLSIFVALQYADLISYGVVGFNFIIVGAFALILNYQPVNLPQLYQNISLNHWLIYSFNFIFLDMIVVVLIRQLLNGMDRTIIKEAFLYRELHLQVAEKNQRNELLRESEEHYRTLFFQSPLPKWIFDMESLRFLQVNQAAIIKYGYSEEEFLTMKISDLHVQQHVPELLLALTANEILGPESLFTTKHVKKGGKEIDVEIRRNNLNFKGKRARIVIATDITQQTEYLHAIELKNKQLKEIAYMQSHVVRVPLANIIGLMDLIGQFGHLDDEKEIYNYLNHSVRQLDGIIQNIINHAD